MISCPPIRSDGPASALGSFPCPADQRIQSFLNGYLKDVCPGGAAQLPANTLVLDRAGLARVMSQPLSGDTFASPYLQTYCVLQGILHNPKSDRRTTQGIFHIVEGGLRKQPARVSSPAYLVELRVTIGTDPFLGQIAK